MIVIESQEIPINLQSNRAISTVIDSVSFDYEDIGVTLKRANFFVRRQEPMIKEWETDKVSEPDQFIPIEKFVRKMSKEEAREKEDKLRKQNDEEEEYETLISAYEILKLRAYEQKEPVKRYNVEDYI